MEPVGGLGPPTYRLQIGYTTNCAIPAYKRIRDFPYPQVCIRKRTPQFGGSGWTRTNDVSYVTDLQSATFAARLLTHLWHRLKDLNLHEQFWRLPCYRYIKPICGEVSENRTRKFQRERLVALSNLPTTPYNLLGISPRFPNLSLTNSD